MKSLGLILYCMCTSWVEEGKKVAKFINACVIWSLNLKILGKI